MLICVISTKNRKNRLTNFVDSAILINVVARTAVQTTATILENDTVNKVNQEKNSQISERVNAWFMNELSWLWRVG